MKYIRNESIRLPDHIRKIASLAHIAVVDTEGVFTTAAQFLCGENPWGFHQDYQFSSPTSEVRRGARIVAAAQQARDEDLDEIVLSPEDHAVLLKTLVKPQPSAETPMHPDLARAILPILTAIEFPKPVPTKRAPQEETTETIPAEAPAPVIKEEP